MSDYSSFEKDKKIFDDWRTFLNESTVAARGALNEEREVPPLGRKEVTPAPVIPPTPVVDQPDAFKKATGRAPTAGAIGGEGATAEEAAADLETRKAAARKFHGTVDKKPAVADSPGPDWTKTITDLGGILDTGIEGITSQKRKDKPGFIHTVYRDTKGNPFLADTKGFFKGEAPLPDPGTGQGIWNRDNTLTKLGQSFLASWLEKNPGYSNMLAKSRVTKDYDLDKFEKTMKPKVDAFHKSLRGQRVDEQHMLQKEELIQEILERHIKLTKK